MNTMKALIIDDEIDICYLLSNIVRTQKMEVSFVNSLGEATASLKKQTPQLIFLDNHLPDGLGIDFIKQLKKNNPSSKIVMMTAFDNASERLTAISNGADIFISKPFSKNTICTSIDKLIKQ